MNRVSSNGTRFQNAIVPSLLFKAKCRPRCILFEDALKLFKKILLSSQGVKQALCYFIVILRR